MNAQVILASESERVNGVKRSLTSELRIYYRRTALGPSGVITAKAHVWEEHQQLLPAFTLLVLG
jgi:hypothetical protein